MAGVIKQTVYLVVVLFTVAKCCSGANILILGMPFYSHLFGPANLGQFLQTQGHNVLLAIPPQLKGKLENRGIKLLLYHSLGGFPEDRLLRESILDGYFTTTSLLQSMVQSKGTDMTQRVQQIARKIVTDVNLLKNIENFKPDLIMLDSGPTAVMFTLIPYKLNVPFIMIGNEEFPQCTRAPILPTVFPYKNYPYTDHMTFLQRITNTLKYLQTYQKYPYINLSLIHEYVPEKPYISPIDLQAKALLWIVTEHSVLSYNQPIMPNVRRVAHLQTLVRKPLPPEFQSFIESTDNGIIIVSFGTVLASVPPQVKDNFLAAFEQTKYKFIIQSALPQNNQSDKFMFRKWLPQYDLLCHQKTKLFITHCGANSIQEALIARVPIIGFPVFADQPHNAGILVRKGYGLKLDLRSFSVQELVSAIEEVTVNPSYKAKVEKASAILKSERVPPIEEAAFWINHVLTFGGDHLRSYAQDIPLWKYFGLDIIAFFFILWHVFVYLLIILFKCCFSHCCGRKEKLKDE
jgi:glucuronosyltransferase